MAAMVASDRRHPQGTPGDLPLIGAARSSHPAVTSGDCHGGDWVLPLVRRAQERVMQQKHAILTMGIDKAQYIRQLDGDGHLSIRRLGLLDENFWRAFIDELRAHFHLDNDAERLRRALDGLQASVSVIGEIAMKAVTK